MKILNILLFLLIISSFILMGYLNMPTGNVVYEREKVIVERVIDGDTFEIEDGRKIRMLGINTPEKNMFEYAEARTFLNETILGREVEIEMTNEDKDRYGRLLRYVFLNGKMVNEEILKKGLASYYVYEEDSYSKRLESAELNARTTEKGIWRQSSNHGCLIIQEFRYVENERCKNQERIILENKCEALKVILKDDATHIYKEEIGKVWSMNFSCVWNDDGDSLYIWDEEGLVLFERY